MVTLMIVTNECCFRDNIMFHFDHCNRYALPPWLTLPASRRLHYFLLLLIQTSASEVKLKIGAILCSNGLLPRASYQRAINNLHLLPLLLLGRPFASLASPSTISAFLNKF